MKVSSFLIFTTLGSAIWNTILAVCGYYFASFIPRNQLEAQITRYSSKVGYAFLAIGVVLVVYWIYKAHKK
jgi:membrane protein DedA with SNARE-associated domain